MWISRQRGGVGAGRCWFNPWTHDLGSNRTLVLLRSLIRHFTMIISAWWLRSSSKFSGQELEEINWYVGSMETLKNGCGFLMPRSSHCNEQCADCPIVSFWRCPMTGGLICKKTTFSSIPLARFWLCLERSQKQRLDFPQKKLSCYLIFAPSVLTSNESWNQINQEL